MKIIENSKGKSCLWSFHGGWEQLCLNKLYSIGSLGYKLTMTEFNLDMMDAICVNNNHRRSWCWPAVPTFVAMMAQTK
jgi:hypothetical protein